MATVNITARDENANSSRAVVFLTLLLWQPAF